MKAYKISLLFILAIFIIFSCKKKEDTQPPTPVNTSIITGISTDRAYTKSGLPVHIEVTVNATNPQYDWITTSGTVMKNDTFPNKATYFPCASCAGGITTITCTVTDGSRSEKKSIDIEVQK